MNNCVTEIFDADPELCYSDGDLVGICDDGLVRPISYGNVVNYIGVVTIDPKVTYDKSKVLVMLLGKKECCVKTKIGDLYKLIGKKVLVNKSTGDNCFEVFDEVFDLNKACNGIIIGNIYETSRIGFVKATVLLK